MSSESEQLSPAQQSVYLNFTRKLAHNEKKTRDRAVRFVAKWLAHQPKASEADLRKLWQGLFFCLWHADKLIIQAEVATSIAGLMHSGKTVEAGMRYLAAGLWTLHMRWMTIDRHRVDKFLSLLRHLLRQALLVLARHQWRAEDIARFAQVMKTYPLGSADKSVPLCPGITLHFADIFMDELKLAVETGADGEGNLELRAGAMNDVLEPFLQALSQFPDNVVLKRIEERVLGPVIRGAVRHVELAPTSPFRFVDYTALASRFFEIAASKETKESHRARFYRYKKELQKVLETPSVRRMELETPEANGTSNHHHHQNGNGLAKEAEEIETDSKANVEEEEEEENQHEENGTEEAVEHMNGQDEDEHKDEEEEEQPVTKKRKHNVVKRHSAQPTWMLAFLKKPRLSLNTLPMPDDDEEEDDTNTAAAQAPVKRRTGPRLRFSLESNSIQEFRKIDPPAKLGSSPVPNRKPTTSILKGSPLVKPAAPRH